METIHGKIISLRPLEPEDLDLLYAWENNPDNWQVSQTLTPFSKNILKKYLDNAQLDLFQIKQLRLVIMLKDDSRPVGLIDLFDFDPYNQRAGLGILIGEQSDRKKGYAAEALIIMIEYCFTVLILNQVYCNILESNKTSERLFTLSGFNKVGTKKSWIRKPDGWENENFYQLLRQDWLSS